MHDAQLIWTNYHTHCYLDDGNGKPEEYVEEGIRKGLRALGFSCHAPLPFQADWVLPKSSLPVYIREISALKKKYAEKIEVYLGLEVDYLRRHEWAETAEEMMAEKMAGIIRKWLREERTEKRTDEPGRVT